MKTTRIPTRDYLDSGGHRYIEVQDRSSFYAPTALGRTRRITPEGYLLCEGVPIARTGTQVYNAEELYNPDPDATQLVGDEHGRIVVDRIPAEVFREETIASFEGKDVTIEHPEEFITPETWRDESVGHLQNVRRGAGLDEDLLLADVLIKAPDAISYVNRELPEVSCGYDSEYEQVAPGRAIQRNIFGNHLALVRLGRAGPRCAFKDHSTIGENSMLKLKTNDTLLTAGKILHAEEGPTISDQGKRWTGGGSPDVDGFAKDVATVIGAMSDADRQKVWATLQRYSGAGWKVDGVGTATGDLAAVNRSSRETAAQINKDGKAFWDDRANRNIYDADRSRPRLNTTTTSLISDMNRAAREFWNQDPPHG